MGRRRRSSSKKDTSDVAQRVTRFVGGASGHAETAPPWSPSSHCCSATSSTGNGGPHEPELRLAMVTWIERTYRPRRRRALGQLTAIEFVTVAVMGLDRQLPVIWPVHPDATATEIGGSGVVVMDGAVQRGGLHARTVLCPVNDRLV